MITKRQRKALLFIEAEIDRTGAAPTIAEITAHLHYSHRPAALKLLLGLESRGYIRRKRYGHRSIEVTRPVSRFEAFKFDPKTKRLHRAG